MNHLQKLFSKTEYTQKELAQIIGISQSKVSTTLSSGEGKYADLIQEFLESHVKQDTAVKVIAFVASMLVVFLAMFVVSHIIIFAYLNTKLFYPLLLAVSALMILIARGQSSK